MLSLYYSLPSRINLTVPQSFVMTLDPLIKHLYCKLNFVKTSWPEEVTSFDLQKKFLGLLLYSELTHKSSKVLDMLYTNLPDKIKIEIIS